jgi:hypothetical protein
MHTKISQETRLNFGTFSVEAGTKKKADNRADEITLVEENHDHYDCESDVSELHMPAT